MTKLIVVTSTCSPSSWEVEAEKPGVQGQPEVDETLSQ